MCRDKHRIATLLCLLGLWLQLMAPALALGMQGPRFDPSSTICHGGSNDRVDGHGHSLPHAPVCDHCLFCHAVTSGPPADERPAFTLFDYPDAAPVRWRKAVFAGDPPALVHTAQPRGPPNIV